MRALSRTSKILRSFAIADVLVVAYLLELNVAVLLAPNSAFKAQSLLQVFGLLAMNLLCLVLVRGGLVQSSVWNAALYRVGIFGTVQSSYFFFKHLLPVVNPGSLDHK